VLLNENRSGFEFRVALPQTGRFADLKVARRFTSASIRQRAICFADTGGRLMSDDPMALPVWRRRLVLTWLLAPALLWLLLLMVMPHVDLAVLSLRQRVAPARL